MRRSLPVGLQSGRRSAVGEETIDDRRPTTNSSTLDAFHRGAFHLVQPTGGHRAGMDAMMLAAALPSDFAGHVVDFGAGAGAAGLAVVSRCLQARATLVEINPVMIEAAAKTLAHPQNSHLARRVNVVQADVTLTGKARAAAGLADNAFDFAIMNPPFNMAADRESPDPQRRQAHVGDDALFEDWLRSAAAVVKPRGGMALIARPQSLRPILDALARRFGSARIVPIQPRPETAAIRIVVRAMRGARGALSLEPPVILHETGSDRFTARADAITNGNASLFGD